MFPHDLAMLLAAVLSAILLGFALVILFDIFTGKIDISDILAESEGASAGKASLSRLQFLIFTFIIAGLYLVICIESGTFVEIPQGVLVLLGISGGSYVISKGIAQGAQTRRAEIKAEATQPPLDDTKTPPDETKPQPKPK